MDFINDWKKSDNFSKARHQELVDGHNLSSIITATGELQVGNGGGRTIIDSRAYVVDEIFIGQITDTGPNGESDWTDARYFVQRKIPVVGTPTDPITMEDDPNPESEMTSDDSGDAAVDDIVTATNPLELDDATHNLPVGRFVTVLTAYAYKSDQLYKIYLIAPDSGGSVDVLNNGTNIVSATPFINLPTNRGTATILEFAAATVSGTPGANLQFAAGAVIRQVLQYNGSVYLWDYVRFHS